MSLWHSSGLCACSACRPLAQPKARNILSDRVSVRGARPLVAPPALSPPPRSTSAREPYSHISNTKHTLRKIWDGEEWRVGTW